MVFVIWILSVITPLSQPNNQQPWTQHMPTLDIGPPFSLQPLYGLRAGSTDCHALWNLRPAEHSMLWGSKLALSGIHGANPRRDGGKRVPLASPPKVCDQGHARYEQAGHISWGISAPTRQLAKRHARWATLHHGRESSGTDSRLLLPHHLAEAFRRPSFHLLHATGLRRREASSLKGHLYANQQLDT